MLELHLRHFVTGRKTLMQFGNHIIIIKALEAYLEAAVVLPVMVVV